MVARLLNELLEISQPNINKGKNVGFDIFHSLTSLRGLSVFKVQTTQSRNQSVSDQPFRSRPVLSLPANFLSFAGLKEPMAIVPFGIKAEVTVNPFG